MNTIKISFFAIALVFAICSLSVISAARKKSDIIVLGGDEGCGPQLVLKTGDKKKGDILVMNPCKKKETKYVAYPVYESHQYESHDSGYDMGGSQGGSYGGGDNGGY